MNPPEKALVLSVDEKSQIQALDRTQPGLPLNQGAMAPELMIISVMAPAVCLLL